jgi:hypothetical protein
VQCTSPIRRYHDLYNHYQLKAAMHEASLRIEWADIAKEQAGILKMEQMATQEERQQTLQAIRMVTRQRERHWLRIYMDNLLVVGSRGNSPPVFDCIVFAQMTGRDAPGKELEQLPKELDWGVFEILALELGTFYRYKMFHPDPSNVHSGDALRCRMVRRNAPAQLISKQTYAYLFIPDFVRPTDLPPEISSQLVF